MVHISVSGLALLSFLHFAQSIITNPFGHLQHTIKAIVSRAAATKQGIQVRGVNKRCK